LLRLGWQRKLPIAEVWAAWCPREEAIRRQIHHAPPADNEIGTGMTAAKARARFDEGPAPEDAAARADVVIGTHAFVGPDALRLVVEQLAAQRATLAAMQGQGQDQDQV